MASKAGRQTGRGCGILALVGLFLCLPRDFAWAQCTTLSGSWSLSFATDPYLGDGDFAATTASGWGKGPLTTQSAKGAFVSSGASPVNANFGVRVLAAQEGKVASYADMTLPLVFATDTDGCHIGFWRYDEPVTRNNSAGTDPASVSASSVAHSLPNTSVTYPIDDAAVCGAGMALAVTPFALVADNLAEPKAAVVAVTPQNLAWEGSVQAAALYLPNLSPSNNTFQKVDITATLQAAGISLHGGAPIVLSDVNGDGRADLLVASSTGSKTQVWVFYADAPPTYPYSFSAGELLLADAGYTGTFASSAANLCQLAPPAKVRAGITALARADFDGDGIPDIAVASIDDANVNLFRGLSNTNYVFWQAFGPPDSLSQYGGIVAEDFTGDGTIDLALVGSLTSCGLMPIMASVLWPNDGRGNFRNATSYFIESYAGSDWGTSVTRDLSAGRIGSQGHELIHDLLLGRKTQAGRYLYYFNYGTNLGGAAALVPSSVAQSKSLTRTVPNMGNLVDVTVNSFSTTTPSGSSIVLQVSADNGQTWEALTALEVAGKTPHPFKALGRDFKWRAQFSATGQILSGNNARYSPAVPASQSPQLQALQFTYRYAPAQTVSQSKVAYGTLGSGTNAKEWTYSAAYDTPAFTGHLTALSLATVAAGGATGVQTLTQTPSFDAGLLLAGTSPGSRTLYTGQVQTTITRNNMRKDSLQRIAWNGAQLNAPSNNPTLASQMGLSGASGPTLLTLLQAGGDPNAQTKLRDAGHSSPIFVGPPTEDANVMGHNYATYAQSLAASRSPFVLLGANDGMLHAFDAANGRELWGYVPQNLLHKLPKEITRDENNLLSYTRQALVDGPVAVADVYDPTAGWRSVAFVTQAQGTSDAGQNWLTALDITANGAPTPLWQFTEGQGSGLHTCDPNACAQRCYTATSSTSEALGDTYHSTMVTPGIMQAEHFLNESQGTSGSKADWLVLSPGAYAGAQSGSYVQPSNTSVACSATTRQAAAACPQLSFHLGNKNVGQTMTLVPQFLVYRGAGPVTLAYSIDNNPIVQTSLTFYNAATGWVWGYGPTVTMHSMGDSNNINGMLTIYMVDASVALDAVALTSTATQPTLSGDSAYGSYKLTGQSTTCWTACLANPNTTEWPTCGVGSGQKCCPPTGGGKEGYCLDVNALCASPNSQMGESYSLPAVGRIRTSTGDAYVAFFASGYASDDIYPNEGRSLYMVNAYTGQPMGSWNLPLPNNFAATPLIDATVPGSVALVDADADGYVDHVYVGDLAGRLWKLNTYAAATVDGQGRMANPNQYAACVLFDAGNPTQGASRTYAPILTKPAVLVAAGTTPNVFFGTGGDARAPSSVAYSFYSVRDTDALTACSATPRTLASLSSSNAEWVVTEPAGQGRFWADPTLVGGTTVIFSSSTGDPASVNPCVAVSGTSHVYGLAAQTFTDLAGVNHKAGTSVFSGVPYYATSGTITAGGVVRGQSASAVTRPVALAASQATDVLIQKEDGTVARVSTPGAGNPPSRLKVTRVRRVSY